MGRADEQRGRLPEIRASQDTITFVMTIAEKDGVARKLVLRCERDGDIFASIVIDPLDPKD
jgi:hypothetical protein